MTEEAKEQMSEVPKNNESNKPYDGLRPTHQPILLIHLAVKSSLPLPEHHYSLRRCTDILENFVY
jgi:hypothetical protein